MKIIKPAKRTPSNNRRGAAAVETAIIIGVFLVIVLGMLELALGVFRYNVVSQAARQAARQAIVHGKLAPPELNEWGPATYSSNANSGDEIATSIKPYMAGLDLNNSTITIEWLEGDTALQSRVRATITTSYDPFLTFIFGSTTWAHTAVATLPIAH